MQPAVLVHLKPVGPWRSGPGFTSDRQGVDALFRSDRLFSALTLAFSDLGYLDEWLDATARAAKPAVRLGSLFPFQADTLFAAPPNTTWPPPASLVTSPSPLFLSRLRWANARFVPITLIQALITGQAALADQWIVDAESACLLRRDRPSSSPFRHTVRRRAAVDRIRGTSPESDAIACVEFEPASGLWTAITFADRDSENTWGDRIQGAFRLLSDSGFGGGRRIGWGQIAPPQFERGAWPHLLLPKITALENPGNPALYWLLSLYSPASEDRVDWKAGDYRTTTRGGHVPQGELKKVVQLIDEGSVIAAASDPVGRAVDVAPESFAHPVYRAGFALTVRLPELTAVEPSTVEAEARVELPEPTHPAAEVEPEALPEALPEPSTEATESTEAASAVEIPPESNATEAEIESPEQ